MARTGDTCIYQPRINYFAVLPPQAHRGEFSRQIILDENVRVLD